jgi:nucleoside-diphosphate-sugar epimerase
LKILLTGADGFTGRHFVPAAVARGHEVVPLRCDLTQPSQVESALASVHADAVVHLAAIAFVAHDDPRAFYDVNLFGTLNLLRALQARALPLHKVLLASSANVYGNAEHSPIPETQPPAPVNHYAMSKLSMELMARAHFPSLPLVISRPFNYTGPGQAPQFVIPKLVEHFRRREPVVRLGNLHVEREYNDVRFVCEAYLALLEAEGSGSTYNVCSGVTHSLGDVVNLLVSLAGHTIEVRVDEKLVRPNEIHRLCGDPSLLRSAIGTLPSRDLRETLAWMLESDA